MRIERLALVSILALTAAMSACGSILQTNSDGSPDAERDGSQDSGGVPCRQLGETACRARNDCAVGACSLCGGGGTFVSCYDRATESPPACIGAACPQPCPGLDEATCKAHTECRVDTCPGCNGASSFTRCAALNDPPSLCPAILCPVACAEAGTKDACEARPDCHSVFVDGRNCACAALGCCARFSRCADGGAAACKAPVITCDAATPYCEGPFVVSYSGSCYEGCVQATDCALN